MYRPKHVEWTCREINSLHIVASVGHSIELAVCLFRTTKWLIKKPPVPTQQATFILIKVKPYNELLCMLLACILSLLKSVLKNKFLILDTYHPDTLSLREKEGEDPWSFFEAKMGPQANTLETLV